MLDAALERQPITAHGVLEIQLGLPPGIVHRIGGPNAVNALGLRGDSPYDPDGKLVHRRRYLGPQVDENKLVGRRRVHATSVLRRQDDFFVVLASPSGMAG